MWVNRGNHPFIWAVRAPYNWLNGRWHPRAVGGTARQNGAAAVVGRPTRETRRTAWPVCATPTTLLATSRPVGTQRDVLRPPGKPGRLNDQLRPSVLRTRVGVSELQVGGRWGAEGGVHRHGRGQAGAVRGLRAAEADRRGTRRTRARGIGAVGVPRAPRSGRAAAQRRGSPAAGSPAEPCAAPAVAREWQQGVGRGAGARTLSVSSAPSPRA